MIQNKSISEKLAKEKSNVVISIFHGLRIGSQQLLIWEKLPEDIHCWIFENSYKEILLSAHHFDKFHWEESLKDTTFPKNFVKLGGRIYEKFTKVVLVNSFDPGLKFVYPYRPTEYFATVLLTRTTSTDARVYDPNLEPLEVIQSFPRLPLRLFEALEAERFDIIVQTIFNVDYDLRILCEMRKRAPKALLIIGGPHLQTVDIKAYFKSFPIDGLILGDGENSLIQLVHEFHKDIILSQIPGIITRDSLNEVPTRYPRPKITPSAQKNGIEESINGTPLNKNIWGLTPYISRCRVITDQGKPILPYDIIGLNPLRVVTSQKCAKACYWCKAPKQIDPRKPAKIVEEIKYQYDQCDSIHFEDNEIWFSPDNFYKIGELIIANGLTSKPMLVKTSTDQITPTRAKFMYEMGIQIVALGVESFDQESLDLLKKDTTIAHNHQALKLVLGNGMKPGINTIWLVPAINLTKTKELILSSLPYLKRGAYLNLVPELEMGDVKKIPPINYLLHEGYFRNEPKHFPGMLAPVYFLKVHLCDIMITFKKAVLESLSQKITIHKHKYGENHLSVAVWSLYLLQSIVIEFPDSIQMTERLRKQISSDLDIIIQKVIHAEDKHKLFYETVEKQFDLKTKVN